MTIEIVMAVAAVAGVGLSLAADAMEERAAEEAAQRDFHYDLHVDQALAVAATGRWES